MIWGIGAVVARPLCMRKVMGSIPVCSSLFFRIASIAFIFLPRTMDEDLLQTTREALRALDVQRQSLETEAEAITSELTSPPRPHVPPMGIDTPLVDAEGYPRNDIDLVRARSLRGRLSEIKTDHKALMKDMDRHLQQLAALQSPSTEADQQEYAARLQPKPKPKYDPQTGKWVVKNWDGSVAGVPNGEHRRFDDLLAPVVVAAPAATAGGAPRPPRVAPATEPGINLEGLTPFCRVNSVAEDSPAEKAGLQVGDLILAMGNINARDTANPFRSLAPLIPEVASRRETVTIYVRRDNTTLPLTLRPQPWAGRGLLGCHLIE